MKTNTIPLFRGGILTATLATALLCQRTQANNILGLDVTSGQGSINWSEVHANGADFAFARATEGNYFEDTDFKANMVNGKDAGLLMGAYAFARPDIDCPSTDANYFWKFAGGYITGDGKSIDPAVMFEIFNGSACQPSYTAWLNAYAKDIEAKNPGIKHVVVYCGCCSGACDLTEYDKTGGIGLQAWIVCYNGENLYTGNPWSQCDCCNAWAIGCGTGGWTYWQFTDTGSIGGVAGGCDLDAYNGGLTSLKDNEVVQ